MRKARWLNSAEVAVKCLNNIMTSEFDDDGEMVGFYKEIEVLSQLRHPEIVEMVILIIDLRKIQVGLTVAVWLQQEGWKFVFGYDLRKRRKSL